LRFATGFRVSAARFFPVSRSARFWASSASFRIVLWEKLGSRVRRSLHAGRVHGLVSLIGVVLFGTLAGSMLPFILRRLGFDPATASAPFVATLVDVTGLCIYFTVALMI